MCMIAILCQKWTRRGCSNGRSSTSPWGLTELCVGRGSRVLTRPPGDIRWPMQLKLDECVGTWRRCGLRLLYGPSCQQVSAQIIRKGRRINVDQTSVPKVEGLQPWRLVSVKGFLEVHFRYEALKNREFRLSGARCEQILLDEAL